MKRPRLNISAMDRRYASVIKLLAGFTTKAWDGTMRRALLVRFVPNHIIKSLGSSGAVNDGRAVTAEVERQVWGQREASRAIAAGRASSWELVWRHRAQPRRIRPPANCVPKRSLTRRFLSTTISCGFQGQSFRGLFVGGSSIE